MIRFHDLKVGDIVGCEFDGKTVEGSVMSLSNDEKQVCVKSAVQEFWFSPEHLFPIAVDENQLLQFQFEKLENPDLSVKYMRGPFRILLPVKGQFSSFDIWYREDRRHINHALPVHELQNHYRDMTKVELTRDIV